MKKILLFAIAIICSMSGISEVSATDTVNVYLFSGSTCSYCAEARKFLQEIKSDYPYMHTIEYEVWEHPDNATLHEKVKEQLDSSSKGVPFIVIGDKSFTGFDESRKNDIRRALEYYEMEECPDIVQDVINGVPKKEKEKYESIELEEPKKEIDWENIAIGGIIIVAMCFVVYLYYNTKIRR